MLDKITGLLFEKQTQASLIDAVARFERLHPNFRAEVIRSHAVGFSTERFRGEISKHIEQQLLKRAKSAIQPKAPDGLENMRKFSR